MDVLGISPPSSVIRFLSESRVISNIPHMNVVDSVTLISNSWYVLLLH
jgi:hypothetical protein